MSVTASRQDLQITNMPDRTVGDIYAENPRITARNVKVFYGDKCAIDDVSIDEA